MQERVSNTDMFDNLKNRKPRSIDEKEYRKFAVTVCLVERDGELQVLFEKRASGLKHQPGEICFPGGARDSGESALENALRETREELLITDEQIHVIAQMDTLYTAYNTMVSVFLCELKDYHDTFSTDEVGEIFYVPLNYFIEIQPDAYTNTVRTIPPEDFPYDLIPGGREYRWYNVYKKIYFYNYASDKIIWGLTAYIMRSVADILRYEAGYTGNNQFC